jgi:hypothetical protein
MAKITQYQNIIIEMLEAYASIPLSYPNNLRDEVVADTVRNHFQLITLGWENQQFIHEVIFHIDIIDENIWIQVNNSEANIAAELIERGIPKDAIFIGFQHNHLLNDAEMVA